MVLANRYVIVYQNAEEADLRAIGNVIGPLDACYLVDPHPGPGGGACGVLCVECQHSTGELDYMFAKAIGKSPIQLAVIKLGDEFQTYGHQGDTAKRFRWLFSYKPDPITQEQKRRLTEVPVPHPEQF